MNSAAAILSEEYAEQAAGSVSGLDADVAAAPLSRVTLLRCQEGNEFFPVSVENK